MSGEVDPTLALPLVVLPASLPPLFEVSLDPSASVSSFIWENKGKMAFFSSEREREREFKGGVNEGFKEGGIVGCLNERYFGYNALLLLSLTLCLFWGFNIMGTMQGHYGEKEK